MQPNAKLLALLPCLALFACGGATQPAATPTETTATTTAAPAAAPSATVAPPPAATAPSGPTAKLDGKSMDLAYDGATYALSHATVVGVGNRWELHFEQPMSEGYNQIWLMPRDVKKGQPAKVEGTGMNAVFVQIAKGKADVKNVSSSCSATGTVTFDDVPVAGKTAKGSVDVTITCTGVAPLTGPIAIKGTFADLPVAK
jgi:hypothetical protein